MKNKLLKLKLLCSSFLCIASMACSMPLVANATVGTGDDNKKSVGVTAVQDTSCGEYNVVLKQDEDLPVFKSGVTPEQAQIFANDEVREKVDHYGYDSYFMIGIKKVDTSENNKIVMDISIVSMACAPNGRVDYMEGLTDLGHHEIAFSFEAPDWAIDSDGNLKLKTFSLMREHDGVTESIPITYSKAMKAFYFRSSKFSEYTFAYEMNHSGSNTGSSTNSKTTENSSGTGSGSDSGNGSATEDSSANVSASIASSSGTSSSLPAISTTEDHFNTSDDNGTRTAATGDSNMTTNMAILLLSIVSITVLLFTGRNRKK